MKKLWLRIFLWVAVPAAAIWIIVSLSLSRMVRNAVVTVGPEITQVDVKLENVSLSLLSGSAELRGLVVGNPEGFKTPSAIEIAETKVWLEPRSMFSDKVLIRSIQLQSPLVTLEGSLNGNNLNMLLHNIEEFTGGSRTPAADSAASKKLQVDEFIMRSAQLRLSLVLLKGKSATVPLPDIELRNLGQGPEGITAADLARQVVRAILEQATVAAKNYLAGFGGKVGESAKDAADKVMDIFKKK